MNKNTRYIICKSTKLASFLATSFAISDIIYKMTSKPKNLKGALVHFISNTVCVVGSSWLVSEGVENLTREMLGCCDIDDIFKYNL